jgi:hypothetical protein
MGASNFHYVNARRVYAVCMEEHCDYDEELEFTKDYLVEQGFDPESGDMNGELRSYPSRALASIRSSYPSADVSVTIIVGARSGYYEGACLDYDIQVDVGYTRLFTEEIEEQDVFESIEYHYDNAGMRRIQARNITKWVNRTIESERAKVEEILAKACGIELVEVATFSNGETIYKQA